MIFTNHFSFTPIEEYLGRHNRKAEEDLLQQQAALRLISQIVIRLTRFLSHALKIVAAPSPT
jgi:hypothetical protein